MHQSADSINVIAEHIYGVTYDMMRALRPTVLDDLGLVDAIRECISNMHFKRNGIDMKTDFSGALNDMDEYTNITVYRLVQESLNNIVKHADATEIKLTLRRQENDEQFDEVSLTIADDGCGFDSGDLARAGATKGFGLINMRERALALGGTLTVESNDHDYRGTVITAHFPVPAAALEEESFQDDPIPELITAVEPQP